jgi:hypothetical protein
LYFLKTKKNKKGGKMPQKFAHTSIFCDKISNFWGKYFIISKKLCFTKTNKIGKFYGNIRKTKNNSSKTKTNLGWFLPQIA